MPGNFSNSDEVFALFVSDLLAFLVKLFLLVTFTDCIWFPPTLQSPGITSPVSKTSENCYLMCNVAVIFLIKSYVQLTKSDLNNILREKLYRWKKKSKSVSQNPKTVFDNSSTSAFKSNYWKFYAKTKVYKKDKASRDPFLTGKHHQQL